MKKIARALALVTGLTLLAGCDSVLQNWIPLAGADHRPEVKKAQVTGFVVDAAGNDLPGAMVSNGASVTFTAEDGSFTLSNVRTGLQTITASFEGKKSFVDIEVRSGANSINPPISVGVSAPVSSATTALKFEQIFPDTLVATYSTSISSDSAEISYGATTYQDGRDVTISLASPPNGKGNVLLSYQIAYENAASPPITADFLPTIRVEPGSLTKSGPLKNVLVKNIGPSSSAFSKLLAESETGMVEAIITFYTADKEDQAEANQLHMHAPVLGNKDKSLPFKARVTIMRAER